MSVSSWDCQTPAPFDCLSAVLALGNFDGVHRGHADLIQRLQRMAVNRSTHPVAVTFDPHPLQFLSRQAVPIPLATLATRCERLLQAGAKHVLILQVTPTLLQLPPEAFFKQVLVDRLHVRGMVEGPTFAFGKDRKGTIKVLETLCHEANIPLEIAPPTLLEGDIVSSSLIRQALLNGDVCKAAKGLGRPYMIQGKVVRGAGRGVQIGFPTANLEHIQTLLPGQGVYAGFVDLHGTPWPAAINIGPNPTFDEQKQKVEVHLIGYQGTLYEQIVNVAFLARLRDTQAFASVEALRRQLTTDVEASLTKCKQHNAIFNSVKAASDLHQRVEKVLDATLRPILQDTGGNVVLLEITSDKVARIGLQGTCRGCPSSVMSIIMGIESELRELVPEIAYLEVASE